MNPNTKLIPLLTALVLCVGACTKQVSNLKFASTNIVDVSQQYVLVASDVSAKSAGTFVLVFSDMEDPSYYKALGECLSQHDGDILTDVEVKLSNYWFLIGFHTRYTVTGNVWKMVDEVGSLGYNPDKLFSFQMIDGESYLVSRDGEKAHRVSDFHSRSFGG